MTSTAFQKKFAAQWSRLIPLRKRLQRNLPPCFAQIRSEAEQVDLAMKEIEEHFLRIGTSLECINTTGNDLVSHCESLISLALGQGGGEIMIEDAAQHIWRAVEFVEKNDHNMERLIQQLTNSNERISQTLATEQILLRTLAPLNFVKTLFRVESAGLPPDVQDMFYALAREIDRIRQRVEGGFREKFQLIREIQAILGKAITRLIREQMLAKQSVAGLRQHMTESLANMKVSYEKNRDRDTRLSGVSQAMNDETSRVVMSLQSQDILTQKLQHIHKVIEEMEQRFASLPAEKSGTCTSLHFIAQSGRIAVAHLASMIEEMSQAGQNMGEGLNQIIRQMEALDGNCLALRDLDTVTTGVDGAVQILLDSLDDVQRLMTTADHQAKEAHETIAPIGGMTTNFTGFMRELSLEIQLIGLNAEVQAAHVGQGTGLEVLSAHTSSISRETSQLSEALAKDLDTLTSGLDQVVAGFREIREENAKFSEELVSEFKKDTALLHDYRNSSFKVLEYISALLPTLNNEIRSALDQVDFAGVASQPLAALQNAVAALADTAQSAADLTGIKVETTGLTDHQLVHYTMRSEVDVHRNIVGTQSPSARPTPAAPPQQQVDVELFDEIAPVTRPADVSRSKPIVSPAVPVAASADSNVDLWEDLSSPVSSSSAPSPSSKENQAA